MNEVLWKLKAKMVWASPQFKRETVNRAGQALVSGPPAPQSVDEVGVANLQNLDDELGAFQKNLGIINNWRSSHSYPMNTFQATLRKRAGKMDKKCIFATRIKRLESIEKKLQKRKDMKLTQMQDIGGLRAVLGSTELVYRLYEVYESKRLDHVQAKVNDYITTPKPDGYRGIHLIYKYRGGGRTPLYDDLKVEIQIRSVVQHAWATAVETVGIFTKQALKSSDGDERWLRFFSLASAVIAESEGYPSIPGTPIDATERDLEFRQLASALNVREVLQAYQGMLRALERQNTKDAKFFLLSLEPEEGRISAKGFLTRDSIEANQQYIEMEQSLAGRPGANAVLVKVDSVSALRRAYPNYFADTTTFIQLINQYLPPATR